MARKKSKRHLKKGLRQKEARLNRALVAFLEGYGPRFKPDIAIPDSPEAERQFILLKRLKGIAYDILWFRIRTSPQWRGKNWYLDFFQIDNVSIEDDVVEMTGDAVWWAEGAFAREEWWPMDHVVNPEGFYKRVLRAESPGGKYVIEPLKVRLKMSKKLRCNATYWIEFGFGSTYFRTSNFQRTQ